MSDTIDVLIDGTEIAQLAIALDCLAVGLKVAVLMTDDENLLQDPQGAQADPDCAIADLIDRVATPLKDSEAPQVFVHKESPQTAYVWQKGAWLATESEAVLGIPTSPLAKQNIAILGFAGANRAYLDRLKPVLTIGKAASLTELIETRVGKKAYARLSHDQLLFRYAEPLNEVEVSAVLPGLNETLTRAGSLSGAVLAYQDRYLTLGSRAEPNIGWPDFKRLMLKKIELYGGDFVTEPVAARVVVQKNEPANVLYRAAAEIDLLKNVALPENAALPDDGVGYISWVAADSQTYSAAVSKQKLEIRGPLGVDPPAISQSVIAEALQLQQLELAGTEETAVAEPKHTVLQQEFVTEEALRVAAEALDAEIEKIVNAEENAGADPITVKLTLHSDSAGLAMSLREASLLAVQIRRKLLGIAST